VDHDQFIQLVHRRAEVPSSRRLAGRTMTNMEMGKALSRATLLEESE
jgi:hypothetical protein